MNVTEARMMKFGVEAGPEWNEAGGGPGMEWLWGEWVGDRLTRVCNTPFFTTAFAMDDVVKVAKDGDGTWRFVRVVRPGGRRTVTGFYEPESDDDRHAVRDHFHAHDVRCERGFGDMLSLSVPRHIAAETLRGIAACSPVFVILDDGE